MVRVSRGDLRVRGKRWVFRRGVTVWSVEGFSGRFFVSFLWVAWGFIDVEGRVLKGNEIRNTRAESLRCMHKKRE